MKNKMKAVLTFSLFSLITGFSTETRASQVDATSTIAESNASGASTDTSKGEFRKSHSRDKKVFYRGVCVGQVLFKQGIDLSNLSSSATREDLKSAIKAAIQTCKDSSAQARDTATHTATSTATATSTSTETSTATSTDVTP